MCALFFATWTGLPNWDVLTEQISFCLDVCNKKHLVNVQCEALFPLPISMLFVIIHVLVIIVWFNDDKGSKFVVS